MEIQRLPKGYDTFLGSMFEEGKDLSTGEWQKVALARSFLRQSRIVVLDEQASSLDPLAEAALFDRFRSLIDGRSAILISHRFSTVRMADQIYVLDKGRVVECATPRAGCGSCSATDLSSSPIINAAPILFHPASSAHGFNPLIGSKGR